MTVNRYHALRDRCRRLTETVDDHTADQIFRIGISSGARVRAHISFGESSYHQPQIVAGSKRSGHVRSGGPATAQIERQYNIIIMCVLLYVYR